MSKTSKPTKSIEGNHISEAVKLGDVEYVIGHGGLHSVDQPAIWEADAQFRILDMDVRSFYPTVIENHRLVPPHLAPVPFLKAFSMLKAKRLAAKDSGRKTLADGLKISINSLFGKTGSAYGWLTAPTALLSCTIIGQLTLLTFIDLLQIDGVDIISTNTDGVTFRVRRDLANDVIAACNDLARIMRYELDWGEYTKLARRDINNYLAFDANGKVKGKGAYAYDARQLGKKATKRIIIDAAAAYFRDGTPVAETVAANRDTGKLIDYFKCQRGYHIEDDQGGNHGGIARWYIATHGGVHLDKVKVDGKRTQLVERGAKVVNVLPTSYPDDVDVEHYTLLAEKLVMDITNPEVKISSTVPRGEWSAAECAAHQHNYDCADADLDLCREIALPHNDWSARIHGSGYDTMRKLLLRLWLTHRGRMSRGDLRWCAEQLDEADGYFRTPTMQRTLAKMIEWIARDVSPFAKPQNLDEQIERGWTWVMEHVEQLKRRKKVLLHRDVMGSDYLSGVTLRRYDKIRDDFKLSIAIQAVIWKHGKERDLDLVKRIIADVQQYFEEAAAAHE